MTNSSKEPSKLDERFCEFIDQHNLIEEGENVVVCWSAGKDSTALLHLLLEYQSKKHFVLSVVFVPFPKEILFEDGRDETLAYWQKRGIHVNILNPLLHHGHNLKQVPRHLVCLECKKIRRLTLVSHLLINYDLTKTTIATGHTSWDLAAYLLELVVSNMAIGALSPEIASEPRRLEIGNRFLPRFSYPNGPAIIRPLLNLNEQDVLQVLADRDIPYPFSLVPGPCPWQNQRKRIFEDYFRFMGLSFSFERLLECADEIHPLRHTLEYQRLPFETYLL